MKLVSSDDRLKCGHQAPTKYNPYTEILLPPKNAHSNASCANFSLGPHKLLLESQMFP